MAKLLLVRDTVANTCELAPLRPYPTVTAANATVTVTTTVDADGKSTYAIGSVQNTSNDVGAVTFNPATGALTLTATDGSTKTATISLCAMLANITPTTTLIGG